MSEEDEKNRPFRGKAFGTENPLKSGFSRNSQRRWVKQKNVTSTDEVVEQANMNSNIERVGPFYRQKPPTPEQLAARKIKRKQENEELKKIIACGNYDRGTAIIATLLGVLSFGLAKFYLRLFQLWNAALVEGFGVLIYYIFLPIFQTTAPLLAALLLCAAISFFAKFVVYKIWLFKKVGKSAGDSDNSQ